MRIIWDVLERVDLSSLALLDKADRLLGRKPTLERTKERTKDVREPQRIIEFDN